MPHVPKWMGDAMESLLSSRLLHLKVSDTAALSPSVKKICFSGGLHGATHKTGYAVAFRVSATEFRNYTPSYFSPEENKCEIIFHLHGNGPGSDYVAGLSAGDTVKMVMPRGRHLYRDHPYHFFFGDETTIGLYKSMESEIMQRRQFYTGIMELGAVNAFLPEDVGLSTDVLDKHREDKARHLEALLDRNLRNSGIPAGAFVYYLTGNAASIQLFRSILKARGVEQRNIRTQPYWAEGKRGL